VIRATSLPSGSSRFTWLYFALPRMDSVIASFTGSLPRRGHWSSEHTAVRAEKSNRTATISKAVQTTEPELDAEAVLRIAKSIPPETAKRLRKFLEARSDEQLQLQEPRVTRGA